MGTPHSNLSGSTGDGFVPAIANGPDRKNPLRPTLATGSYFVPRQPRPPQPHPTRGPVSDAVARKRAQRNERRRKLRRLKFFRALYAANGWPMPLPGTAKVTAETHPLQFPAFGGATLVGHTATGGQRNVWHPLWLPHLERSQRREQCERDSKLADAVDDIAWARHCGGAAAAAAAERVDAAAAAAKFVTPLRAALRAADADAAAAGVGADAATAPALPRIGLAALRL